MKNVLLSFHIMLVPKSTDNEQQLQSLKYLILKVRVTKYNIKMQPKKATSGRLCNITYFAT